MGKTAPLLEEFIASPHVGVGWLSAIEVDGYLTAVVIGPGLIRPSEWLNGLWDKDTAFDDIEEAQAALNAVMLHYNSILIQLQTPATYRPYGFPNDPTAPEAVQWATEWCRGFKQAMVFRPEDWLEMVRDKDTWQLIATLMCFVENEGGKPFLPLPLEELEGMRCKAVAFIPEVIPLIKECWESDIDYAPHRSRRTGRNDPCPCGSGKKYKRCCIN